jgi:hypothetical protein
MGLFSIIYKRHNNISVRPVKTDKSGKCQVYIRIVLCLKNHKFFYGNYLQNSDTIPA